MRFKMPFALLVLLASSCQTRPTQQAAVPSTPPARTAPDASLRETRWVPRTLGGAKVNVPENTREPYLLLRTDGTAEGNGSCNRFRGTFTSEGPGTLKFGPLMSTRMACPAIGTETEFTRALDQTRTYRVSGDTLRLLDAANVPLARLEAVYLR